MAIESMKDLTQEFMMEYIDKKDPSFKEEFKAAALRENKHGVIKYNHIAARYAFCKKFIPELLPKKKEKKPTKTEIMMNW